MKKKGSKTQNRFCFLYYPSALLNAPPPFFYLVIHSSRRKESLAEDTLPLVLEGVDYIPYQKHSSELKIGKMSLIKKYRITVGSLAINRWKENPP